jgi:nitrate/nitrite transporter NarK
MTRGQTIAQAYAMHASGTTFSAFFQTLRVPYSSLTDIAGGRFAAGVSFALFEKSDNKIRQFPPFFSGVR